MKERLTRVQQKVLNFIQQEVRSKGYPPSVREICNGVGLRSTSTVFVHLNNLQELGYIRRDPSKPRAIELLTEEPIAPLTPPAQNVTMVPIVGEIAAGQPILAEEAIDGYLPMATEMVDNGT
ncbi:MAG: repressor LexA, partial [Bacillota bacterium]|nr:repressor LexA [Bacillota bacterium]